MGDKQNGIERPFRWTTLAETYTAMVTAKYPRARLSFSQCSGLCLLGNDKSETGVVASLVELPQFLRSLDGSASGRFALLRFLNQTIDMSP